MGDHQRIPLTKSPFMSHRMTTRVAPALLAAALLAPAAGAQTTGTQTTGAQTSGAPARPAANTAARATKAAAEERAIRALSAVWLEASRRRDAAAIMQLFANDAVTVYGGRRTAGAAAIRKAMEEAFAGRDRRPGFTPSFQTTMVHVAEAGDLAYETGTYEDTWDGGRGRERGHFVTIWRKVDGRWRVVHDVAGPERAEATTPAP
jgi:uncharacterized protein (TIGR02246 family)